MEQKHHGLQNVRKRDAVTGQLMTQGDGGRRAGIPNKLKRDSLLKKCEEAGYNPEDAMLEIAKGELECLTCFGNTETRYVVVDEFGTRQREADGKLKWKLRLCESCLGTGRERMHVTDVLKARTSIFDKIVPSLKQIDHSSTDGSMTPKRYELHFVGGPAVASGGSPKPQLQQKND